MGGNSICSAAWLASQSSHSSSSRLPPGAVKKMIAPHFYGPSANDSQVSRYLLDPTSRGSLGVRALHEMIAARQSSFTQRRPGSESCRQKCRRRKKWPNLIRSYRRLARSPASQQSRPAVFLFVSIRSARSAAS